MIVICKWLKLSHSFYQLDIKFEMNDSNKDKAKNDIEGWSKKEVWANNNKYE